MGATPAGLTVHTDIEDIVYTPGCSDGQGDHGDHGGESGQNHLLGDQETGTGVDNVEEASTVQQCKDWTLHISKLISADTSLVTITVATILELSQTSKRAC